MKKKSNYKEDLLGRLSDPSYASGYLNVALEEAMEDGFVGGLMVAIRSVIDAHGGITKFSKKLKGKSRTSLYKTLKEDGNPELSTVLEIIKLLPVHLYFEQDSARKAS
jgi:probable addiction module antidote protein